MIIGYGILEVAAETDAAEALRQRLTDAGADAVFLDTSLPAAGRPALECALGAIGHGDVLLAMMPRHLANSVPDLIALSDRLTAMGATMRVIQVTGQQELDTGTPTGAMMLAALSLLAAFDRPGGPLFSPAVPAGGTVDPLQDSFAPRRPRGRPPTASTQAGEIARLRAAGMRATDIAERLGICRASVYRVLNMHSLDGADTRQKLSNPEQAGLAMLRN